MDKDTALAIALGWLEEDFRYVSYECEADAQRAASVMTALGKPYAVAGCKEYQWYIRPGYPVPAIPLVAVWQDEPWFADTVRIESVHGDERVIEAIYDENWDRCMDFNVPHCSFYSTQNYFSL